MIASCAFSVNFVALAILMSLFNDAFARLSLMQKRYLVHIHSAASLTGGCRRTARDTRHHGGGAGAHALAAPAWLAIPGSQMGHQLLEVGSQSLQRRIIPRIHL